MATTFTFSRDCRREMTSRSFSHELQWIDLAVACIDARHANTALLVRNNESDAAELVLEVPTDANETSTRERSCS
jgi:hypothetical protein